MKVWFGGLGFWYGVVWWGLFVGGFGRFRCVVVVLGEVCGFFGWF